MKGFLAKFPCTADQSGFSIGACNIKIYSGWFSE